MTGSELHPIVSGITSAVKNSQSGRGGVLSDVWSGLVGDRIQLWRLRNAAKLSESLGRELDGRGIKLNLDTVPERFAFSWFEKATQEDQPEIQELFTKLLANAAEGREAALDRRNISLVSELTPPAAQLFVDICDLIRSPSRKFFMPDFRFAHVETTPERSNYPYERALEWERLMHLGLIRTLDEIDVRPPKKDGGLFWSRNPFSAVLSNTKSVDLTDDMMITRTGVALALALGLFKEDFVGRVLT